MSAKFPYSLSDENPNLKKQIGCMNGILQLFDRRHFFGGRRISSNNHKRLPPGKDGNHGIERNSMKQKTIGRNLEVVKEKQRVSAESSGTSFSSSSCSSTFSSIECNKMAQPEPCFLGHSIFPENSPQRLPIKQPNSSSLLGKQSPDLRKVVKDSICREAGGLSLKTTTKAKGVDHVMKHVDSPRPAKDALRFSYDGRESRDSSKSSVKLKELPRLSLDSRERSLKKFGSQSISSSLLDDLQRGNGKSSQTLNPHQEPDSNKRPSSVVAKLMGLEVIPYSMSGKDDQMREIKCSADDDLDTMCTSSRKADESKYNKASNSPRTPQRETGSPQLRNVRTPVKPNSRCPLESAPWRQPDGIRDSHKQAFKSQEAYKKSQNSFSSVYGEIEERLTKLEFKRSGKDLGALKQILEAMEKSIERLENKKEDHASDLEPQTSNHGPDYLNLNQNSMLAMQHGKITPTVKQNGPPKKSESSIVIIKPTNVQKPRESGSAAIPIEGISALQKLRTRENTDRRKDLVDKRIARDLTPRKNHHREVPCRPVHSTDKRTKTRTFRSTETSNAPKRTSEEGRSLTTLSPRWHSHHTTQISDSSRTRRHLSMEQIPSGSPSRKLRPQSSNLQESDDQLSEFSSQTRYLSHQGDVITEGLESNISLASQTDIEFTSMDRTKESNFLYQHKDQKKEIPARLSKDGSKAEPTTATLEQPSPVSVLDSTLYREELPSPVQKISSAFKDEETLRSDEAEWSPVDLDRLMMSTRPNLSTQFDRENFDNIKYLVHKLRQMNSTCDEAGTDSIASLCGNEHPEHRYITEILLASGILLKDLGSSSTIIQLHSSAHLINPNLFLVLEQAKGRIELPGDEHSTKKIGQSKPNEKMHRKLIFDTGDEILASKLTPTGFSEPWTSPNKQGERILSGQKLLEKLSTEVDPPQVKPKRSEGGEDDSLKSILREDMMHGTQSCADYHIEVSGVVLNIERLIFKDLIGEIVSGKVLGLQRQPTKHCRQLFPN